MKEGRKEKISPGTHPPTRTPLWSGSLLMVEGLGSELASNHSQDENIFSYNMETNQVSVSPDCLGSEPQKAP